MELAKGRQRQWKMQDAKAQFSLVAKLAQVDGPQRITHRGKDAVVVVSAPEYDRLIGAQTTERPSLVEFLRNSPLRDLEFEAPRFKVRLRKPEF
jgi:prevent-host-death family protein